MPEQEYFTWLLPPDPWRKKPKPSPFKLTREEAEKRHPGATIIEGTREVRKSASGTPFPAGSPYGQ